MLDAKSIFGVDGIVAVVTGGGTGQIISIPLTLRPQCISF